MVLNILLSLLRPYNYDLRVRSTYGHPVQYTWSDKTGQAIQMDITCCAKLDKII